MLHVVSLRDTRIFVGALVRGLKTTARVCFIALR